jgi:hypothetical protein
LKTPVEPVVRRAAKPLPPRERRQGLTLPTDNLSIVAISLLEARYQSIKAFCIFAPGFTGKPVICEPVAFKLVFLF